MTICYNRREYLRLRRKLRKQPIKCEMIMWSKLRNGKIEGFKFRRQYGIGRYIVDFYCPKIKLVIEIDGATHSSKEEIEYDKNRQEYIESLGIKVIRFWNREVYNCLDMVIERIRDVCLDLEGRKSEPHPGPLLGKEREEMVRCDGDGES